MTVTFGLLLPSGCTSWRTQTMPVDEVVSTRHPLRARLVLEDWSVTVVQQPWVSGDTLWGYGGGGTSRPSVHRIVGADGRVGYPVGKVRALQLDHTDVVASAIALVGFIVVGTGAVAVAATILEDDDLPGR